MIVGLDLSNTITGIGAIWPVGVSRPELRWVGSLRMLGTAEAPYSSIRVVNAVHDIEALTPGEWEHPPPARVGIEIPPDTARADVHHGGQAAIGWALGYLQGLVEAPLRRGGRRIAHVEVAAWRRAMLVWSNRWGVLAQEPAMNPPPVASELMKRQPFEVARKGTGFELVWAGCGHRSPVASYEQLIGSPPYACPECEPERLRKLADPAEWRREQWKILACRLVQAHWPVEYAALVADARERVRTEKADHELAGVADACEAVWIACSLLEG